MKTKNKIILYLLIVAGMFLILLLTQSRTEAMNFHRETKVYKVVEPELPTLTYIKKHYSPEQAKVAERIVRMANGFEFTDYLLKIVWCESRFNPKCKHSNGKYGLDRGILQINSLYHPEISDKCAYNVDCSVKWAIKQIEEGRQGMWACDRIVKGHSLQYLEKKYK